MAGRFARIPPEIAADDRLSGRALRVLIALCSFANSDGECWPSLATIAQRSAIDRGKIPLMLRQLETCGWISRERRRDDSGDAASTRYTINYPTELSPDAGAPVPLGGAIPVAAEEATPVPLHGDTVSPPAGLPGVPLGGALTEELFNRSIEQKKRNRESDGRKARRLKLRLPQDTALADDWRQIIAERRPDLDPERVFAGFKRYWTDPDITDRPNAAKSQEGWQRAWINWIERERHGSASRAQRQHTPSNRASTILAAGAWVLDQPGHGESG